MSRKALGKGLEALIPRPTPERAEALVWNRRSIPVDRIVPNPRQPRKKNDSAKLEDLIRSVRVHGVLEPLLVRRVGDRVELVAGERRLRAAQLAEIQEVPVIFVDVDEIGSLEIALIENIQREDLNPVDEARAYHVMMGEFQRTHEQIAEKVGKSRTTITNLIRLLRLPPDLLSMVAGGQLTSGHARALLALENQENQRRAAAKIIKNGWSVRETERQLKPKGPKREKPHPSRDPHLHRVEEAIRRRMGTEARLSVNKRGGGKLELIYGDREDLERVLEILGVQVY